MLDLGRTLLHVAEREPGAVALVDGATTLRYGALVERTLRTVAGLDALGLRRGDHLVTILQNRIEAATLHWACQLAGVVITPVNWRAKPDEAEYVLADAGARAVCFEPVSADAVANAPHAGTIPRIAAGGARGGTVAFDALRARAPADALARAKPDDISVMLYTSGTTGRPKGVPRTHAAERCGALAHVAQNRYGYGERTLGVMPLYHTMGVRSLLAMALISGTYVCQPRFETSGALDLIERHRITNLYLVPTLYHDLLADPGFEAADVSSVRKLGFAGAPMTDGLLRRLAEAFRPELFVNHYGSSEIYTFTVCPDAPAKPGSAGKAGINQRIRVVRIGGEDPHDVTAPDEEGEIIASLDSDEAFAGYWRRPDADAKALHAGWYFTGDIGYFDRDGDLFVTGRVDDMMISGGENVMPVEIESVLSLHPGVAEVAVAGLPDERLGQRITAFVTRRAAAGADVGVGVDAGVDVDANVGVNVDADAGVNVDADAGVNVDADAGVNVDADAGVNVDADVGVNVDADAGVDVDADMDADALDAFCRASELADYKRPRAYVFVRSIPKSPVGKILRRMLIAGEYEAA